MADKVSLSSFSDTGHLICRRPHPRYQHTALEAGEAGLISRRGGINKLGDAQKLVKEALEIAGQRASRLREFVFRVEFSTTARASSFNVGTWVLIIRRGIGTGIARVGSYYEFKAINEALHEIQHAVRRQRYVQQHGSLDGTDCIFGLDRADPRHAGEEVLVDSAAVKRMESIVRPRFVAERKYRNASEADRLKAFPDDSVEDFQKYLNAWKALIAQRPYSLSAWSRVLIVLSGMLP